MNRIIWKTAATLGGIAAIVLLPLGADAHRAWLLPSATVLSGGDNWVTIDAAVSNDLFYFEHMPFRLAGFPAVRIGRGGEGNAPPAATLSVTGPDGAEVEVQNKASGRYRSTFDVPLAKPGTYRIAAASEGLFATWKENGQARRWRGTGETLAKEVPDKAEGLRVTHSQGRIEAFVTAGRPTAETLRPSGRGLELDPITHPNDLVAGEAATFRLVLDGRPAARVKVTVIPGGIRYRQDLRELALETDEAGKFSVTWPEPGLYWISATVQDEDGLVQDEDGGGRTPRRRASYAATLEVLSP